MWPFLNVFFLDHFFDNCDMQLSTSLVENFVQES